MNLTRFTLSAALLIVACSASTAWADSNINQKRDNPAGTAFAKVIDDLPLMPGLRIVVEKDVLFIAKTGRIAQTMATGSVDVDSVYPFYQKSLPQLGWKLIDARTYERENDRLRIDVSGTGPTAATVVKFSVQPVSRHD